MHGNCTKASALEMAKMASDLLTRQNTSSTQLSRPLHPQLRTSVRIHHLPPTTSIALLRTAPDEANVNSAIEYYILTSHDLSDHRLRACTMTLAQMIHEPAFDQLRTKEQLGYVVWTTVRRNPPVVGVRVVVQSERDTVYLENRIDSFLRQYKVRLGNHCSPILSIINYYYRSNDLPKNLGNVGYNVRCRVPETYSSYRDGIESEGSESAP